MDQAKSKQKIKAAPASLLRILRSLSIGKGRSRTTPTVDAPDGALFERSEFADDSVVFHRSSEAGAALIF
nr:hypothetical protein [Parabacteroides goldsteinii]